jgi:hypothetical protein
MANKGLFLYGLIPAAEQQDFGPIGLEDQGAPAAVKTVCVATVGAVVSDCASQKIMPLRKYLDPYHRVIQSVMKTTTIIPIRFGHVAKSQGEIVRMLEENRHSIRTALARVAGCVEMGLKIKWDVDNIFEHFIGIDAELAAFRDEIFGRSRAPSLAEKIELGRLFAERRTRERERETERVTELFRSFITDVKANTPKDETVVMDLAFLVARAKLKAFEERVYQVAATFPSHYLFDYSGPWAPFNFVELDLQTPEL